MKLKRYNYIFLFSFIGIIGITACSSSQKANKTGFQQVCNTTWVVTQLDTTILPHNGVTLPYIQFLTNGKVNGHTSCNSMHGTYTIHKHDITFGPWACTKMLCHESAHIESEYLRLLSLTTRWKIDNHQLVFTNNKHHILIVFSPKQ